MKKIKPIRIVLLCLVGLLAWWLYHDIVVVRRPAYIHEFITPAYIEEAEDFYSANKDLLNQLSELQDTVEGDTRYYYTFHEHTFNTPYIPKEFLDILLKLESNTNESYFVSINRHNVKVRFADHTDYQVFMYHGAAEFFGMDDMEKETILENGWTIQAPFIQKPFI